MQLELLDYFLEDIQWADRTVLRRKTLSLNVSDIRDQIKEFSENISVDYELARPGESKRILHVLDTVLPITKATGGSHTFPGIDIPAQLVGTGQTVRLRNLLVTVTGQFPHPEAMTPIEKPREAMIDMAGPGASYSYGSDFFHLILTLHPDSSISNTAFDQALRSMAIHLARWLSGVEKTDIQAERQTMSLARHPAGLPKVLLIYQIQSQIPFVRTFYYGEEISKTLPTFVHPNEFFDGAVVSGSYESERKIPTSLHCANPFIEELLRRHGTALEFLGVILSRGYNDSFEQKKKMGLWSARLAKLLGADGAIALMEGTTGNTTIDFMQTIKACEEEKVKVVGVVHENNGAKGYEKPLVDHPKEADALISRGNSSERIYLPPLEHIVGGDEISIHSKSKHDPRKPLMADPTIFFWRLQQDGLERVPSRL